MASLKVVLICSVLLTALLAPALARIYIVDDGLPDGAEASHSASKSGGGGSAGGLRLSRRVRDAATGWQHQHQEPSGDAAATSATTRQRNRGRKKYKDTLAEADVRAQEAFEALRTVEKRIRQVAEPSTEGPQASRHEQYRRRKPQEPTPHKEERPTATSRNDEAITQHQPTGDAYEATGPGATGPSSEGADYDDGSVNQEAPELLRVAPQQQPPTAPSRDPLYPSSASETNQLVTAYPSRTANSGQYTNTAQVVTTSSPYNANLAYSTVGKDPVSDNDQTEYNGNNRNSLQFTPSDSRINPYVKTVDPLQYTQVPESTSAVVTQLHTIHGTDGRTDDLENQISSSYSANQPVSDNPSLTSRPVRADDVVAYIRKKFEDHLPAASQQQAYSFQQFNNGQTVLQHSGQGDPPNLHPSASNNVYNHVMGTGQMLRAVSHVMDQNNEPHINQQLQTAGSNNVATFQSSSKLKNDVYTHVTGTDQKLRAVSHIIDQNNKPHRNQQFQTAGGGNDAALQSSSKLNFRPHFDDGRPSEDSHRLVHTGPVLKFTLDDRMTPPSGYDSREHSTERNPAEVHVHSDRHVATRKGKSRDFGQSDFGKHGGNKAKEETVSLEEIKSQETDLAKVQYANSGSTPSMPTEINNSQNSERQREFRPSIQVATAEEHQGGNLHESNIGGLVVTSAPALGSKVQRDAEGFLGNQVSASRTVTGTLKFAPDQTAMASSAVDETANFLSVSGDHHQTQKRTTGSSLGTDPFTVTVGANLQTGSDSSQLIVGDSREARFTFPHSTTGDRMVFPHKVAHGGGNVGYTNSAVVDSTSGSHQMLIHGHHNQGFRHHQPQNMYIQRLRPQRQPGSDIVYGSPPRPGAGRVQRPWGLVRPVRGAAHPHRQRKPQRVSRPLRLHKVPSPSAAGHSATSGDSMTSSSSAGHPVALPAPSYGGGTSPGHVSFVEAGPWGQFKWSVSHDVALKPAFHWR